MRRKYIHRVEVKRHTNSDEADGHDLTVTSLGYSWANIKTVSTNKLVNYGLELVTKAINIELRWRSDLDYEQTGIFFTYKGHDYYPQSVTKVDLEEEVIKIFAIAER